MTRKSDLSKYHHRYTKLIPVNSEDEFRCFYCGEIADTLDHIPPLSLAENYSQNHNHVLVRCCSECNDIAYNENHSCIEDRIDFIKSKMTKKYKKKIAVASKWNDQDLSEVKGLLRKSIENDVVIGLAAKDRIKFEGYLFENYEMYSKSMSPIMVDEILHESIVEAVEYAQKKYNLSKSVCKAIIDAPSGVSEIRLANAIRAKVEREVSYVSKRVASDFRKDFVFGKEALIRYLINRLSFDERAYMFALAEDIAEEYMEKFDFPRANPKVC